MSTASTKFSTARENLFDTTEVASKNESMEFKEKLARLSSNQSELARKVGLSPSAISDMINGRRRPYLDQGFAIARVLGVSLDYLADDTRTSPDEPELGKGDEAVIKIVKLLGREEALRRLLRTDRVIPEAPETREVLRPVATRDLARPKGIADGNHKTPQGLRPPGRGS